MRLIGYIRKPKDVNEHPTWVQPMDKLNGLYVEVDSIDIHTDGRGMRYFSFGPIRDQWNINIKWVDQLPVKLDLI